jgi:F0F1-type ATP synthase assembly protein I
MSNQVSVIVAKAKNNVVGMLVGGGAGFLVGKKVIKTEKTWVLIVSTLVGAVVGTLVSASIKAKSSQPTDATVKVTEVKK